MGRRVGSSRPRIGLHYQPTNCRADIHTPCQLLNPQSSIQVSIPQLRGRSSNASAQLCLDYWGARPQSNPGPKGAGEADGQATMPASRHRSERQRRQFRALSLGRLRLTRAGHGDNLATLCGACRPMPVTPDPRI